MSIKKSLKTFQKQKNTIRFIILFCLVLVLRTELGQNPLFKIDPLYPTKHDIVKNKPTYEGFEGFPVGKDDMGIMIERMIIRSICFRSNGWDKLSCDVCEKLIMEIALGLPMT